ncbi:glycosyltransferase [Enterococcus pingfangensis]|uniref:glycosyltransferase n=1 Tax=Enterococcus pingfangensis TaxID=2559924 RepID=UPI0010F896BE|nr:glycosyltransferase [Enterococcus pingfangensis]
MKTIITLEADLKNKKILFVSTKNLDYIRNTQEIKWLTELSSELKVICSPSKNYLFRLFYVYINLLPQLKIGSFDTLFIGFAPQLLFPFFWLFPKKKLIIFDFFISFYDTLVDDRKKVSVESFIARILHYLDKRTIHKADYVVADTKAHGIYFAEEFDYPKDRITVLYIIADTSIYHPKPRKPNEKFEVVYFGSILPVQGIDIVLESIQLLKNNQHIHFTIIGPIKKKFDIQKVDYPNAEFIPWLSQNDLAKKINQADLALSGHFSATVGKADRTIAGKTYIYLAMDKPIILGDSAANHELYHDTESIHFVERGNPKKLALLIENIADK